MICREEQNKFIAYDLKEDKINIFEKIEDVKKKYPNKEINIIHNKQTYNSYSFPFKLFLDLTDYCNLNCVHCLSASSPLKSTYLSYKNVIRILDECIDYGIFKIKLGGGEPLLYPYFWNVVDYIFNRNSNIRISFSTNGTLINQDIINNIIKYNCKISISLDGTEHIHNTIRKQDVFKIVYGNIKRLVNNNIYPDIRLTLMNENIRFVNEIYKLCEKMNLILKVRRYKQTSLNNKQLLTYDNNYFEKIECLNKLPLCDLEDIMKINFNNNDNKKNKILFNYSDCSAGYRSIHINNYGDISPCVFLGNDFIMGNIKNDTIKNLWDNSPIIKMIRKIENDECKNCSRYILCHNECLAVKWYYKKNLKMTDPACYKKRMKNKDV